MTSSSLMSASLLALVLTVFTVLVQVLAALLAGLELWPWKSAPSTSPPTPSWGLRCLNGDGLVAFVGDLVLVSPAVTF